MGNVVGLAALLISLWQGLVSGSNTLWFNADATVTQFQVTMIVPNLSKGAGAHAVWPGLQNDADTLVFQSVVSDSRVPGTWQFFVEYCCNPDYQASAIRVWPGDSIKSTFSLNSNSQWSDSWSLTPGAAGMAAGQTAQSGSSGNIFSGVMDKAVLSIELQNNAAWDFGQVQWSSMAITAATTTSWCNAAVVASSAFGYSVSAPTSRTSGSSTTCSYNSVIFGGASRNH